MDCTKTEISCQCKIVPYLSRRINTPRATQLLSGFLDRPSLPFSLSLTLDLLMKTPQQPPSRRTKSFSVFSSTSSSSTSSSSSSNPDSTFCNGIPFSWERQPGIPKRPSSPFYNPNRPSALELMILPLPPASISTVTAKKKQQESLNSGSDPFVTALWVCSRDQHRDPEPHPWNSPKVSRSVSDRLGFIGLYASCKSTCSVADSQVLRPRSNRPSYDLHNRRR